MHAIFFFFLLVSVEPASRPWPHVTWSCQEAAGWLKPVLAAQPPRGGSRRWGLEVVALTPI